MRRGVKAWDARARNRVWAGASRNIICFIITCPTGFISWSPRAFSSSGPRARSMSITKYLDDVIIASNQPSVKKWVPMDRILTPQAVIERIRIRKNFRVQ